MTSIFTSIANLSFNIFWYRFKSQYCIKRNPIIYAMYMRYSSKRSAYVVTSEGSKKERGAVSAIAPEPGEKTL